MVNKKRLRVILGYPLNYKKRLVIISEIKEKAMFGWFKSDTPELSVEEKNEIIQEHNSLLQERTSLIEEEITFSDSVDEEVIEVNRCIKICYR